MYNANLPKENELPSSAQLFKSTIAAFVVAAVLLVTVILPSEYGIDPTGVGDSLGLKAMGEIKTQLAEEAANEEAAMVASAAQEEALVSAAAVEQQTPEVTSSTVVETAPEKEVVAVAVEPAAKSESISITLTPGQGAEVKAAMSKADVISYRWTVDTGHLNYDIHGDNKTIDYHGYGKGRAETIDEGELVAAFDGKHRWFWRNRSKEVVTVTLTVTGEFEELIRVI